MAAVARIPKIHDRTLSTLRLLRLRIIVRTLSLDRAKASFYIPHSLNGAAFGALLELEWARSSGVEQRPFKPLVEGSIPSGLISVCVVKVRRQLL